MRASPQEPPQAGVPLPRPGSLSFWYPPPGAAVRLSVAPVQFLILGGVIPLLPDTFRGVKSHKYKINAPFGAWNIIPGKTAFRGGFKGPSQRRAAALPSESHMGRWSTPTTGALSKATPRAARQRFLSR